MFAAVCFCMQDTARLHNWSHNFWEETRFLQFLTSPQRGKQSKELQAAYKKSRESLALPFLITAQWFLQERADVHVCINKIRLHCGALHLNTVFTILSWVPWEQTRKNVVLLKCWNICAALQHSVVSLDHFIQVLLLHCITTAIIRYIGKRSINIFQRTNLSVVLCRNI